MALWGHPSPALDTLSTAHTPHKPWGQSSCQQGFPAGPCVCPSLPCSCPQLSEHRHPVPPLSAVSLPLRQRRRYLW